MSTRIQGLQASDLSIEVQATDDGLCLVWLGKSNDRYPGQVLGPFFDGVLQHAAAQSLPLEMRFHHLEHFNSSTITSVIELIQDARTRGVRLTIAYDGAVKWQRLSFDALRVFDRGDGLLELRGG